MVSCIGHAHQVLVGPAVQVCVLPADNAIASIARLALASEHGVAVMAQVVALGILVAVVCPICAWVAGFAHLRVQHPHVNAEPPRVSNYHRRKKNPGPCHLQTEAPWGRVWVTSVLPLLPLWCPGYRLIFLHMCFFPETAQH